LTPRTLDFSKILDLEMMTFPGGRERTADEFARLFEGAPASRSRASSRRRRP
jgi:hypothetical protein